MADTIFNKNELVLEKVRSVAVHELTAGGIGGKMLYRLTSVEDPSLSCTAEGEEVTDAIGAVITTLYRAKKATFSGTNSLISLDLAAAQYGTEKEVAGTNNKIVDYAYQVLTIDGGKVTLDKEPLTVEVEGKTESTVKYIYSVVDGEIGATYEAGATADADHFVISGKEITVPTDLTGKVYVEYQYETESAVKVTNMASEFPEACSLVIYAYFKDKCNENLTYSGKVICPKAKLNPESIELALTSTGKHPFEFTMMKDYCAEEGEDELFSIIVAQ